MLVVGGIAGVLWGSQTPPSASAAPPKASAKSRKGSIRPVAANRASAPGISGTAKLSQFLGEGRDNHSADTGLLEEWPEKGPTYLGVIKGLGVGFSNFSAADGVFYTLGNFDKREMVVAIRFEDGAKVWEYELSEAYRNNFGDGPRGTPTLDGDRLFALGATGELVCLDRETGDKVWQKNIVQEFGAGLPNWGICESVLIDGDRLICTPGGSEATLAALDKQTGSVVWAGVTPQKDRPGYSSILPIEVNGLKQYAQFTASGVIGMRAADGQFLWRDDSSANGTANCAAPVYANGMLFSSSGYGKGASLLELTTTEDETTARLVHHSNDMKVHHGGLVLVDGHVYGSSDSGGLTCLELPSVKKKWQNRSIGKGSITYADGKLYLRDERDGKVALIRATPDEYKQLGVLEQPNRSNAKAWTYPVVFAGRLFLRDQDELHIYNVSKTDVARRDRPRAAPSKTLVK